jgi:hypothetical protein
MGVDEYGRALWSTAADTALSTSKTLGLLQIALGHGQSVTAGFSYGIRDKPSFVAACTRRSDGWNLPHPLLPS